MLGGIQPGPLERYLRDVFGGRELSIEIITSFDCYLADHFEEVQRATPLSRESRLESGSSPGFPQFHIN